MTWKDVEIKEGISLEKNRIREDLTVFLRVRSMRARLARLTLSSRDKKKKNWPTCPISRSNDKYPFPWNWGTVLPTQFFVSSKIHGETDATNGRAARGRVWTRPPRPRTFRKWRRLPQKSVAHWNSNVNLECTSIYTNEEARGGEEWMRSAFRVVDVENGRLDRAHVCSRILPAWMDGSSSKAAFDLSMLFYNHAFGNTSRCMPARSLKIRTGSPPSNLRTARTRTVSSNNPFLGIFVFLTFLSDRRSHHSSLIEESQTKHHRF